MKLEKLKIEKGEKENEAKKEFSVSINF